MSAAHDTSPTETSGTAGSRLPSTGSVIIGAGILCLVGAGLVLWAHQGDAVFSDVVLAALAWCF
jgi:hypothetical protein